MHATHKPVSFTEQLKVLKSLDFTLGTVFQMTITGGVDAPPPFLPVRDTLIREALIDRHILIGKEEHDFLQRTLAQFFDAVDNDSYMLLTAVISAAAGDYSGLERFARDNNLFPPKAAVLLAGAA